MSIKLQDAAISDLLGGLDAGQFTVTKLVETYLKRIEQVNPRLHAVSQINKDALTIAGERDQERSQGTARGILHGIPILVKDLFMTEDSLESTNGCSGLVGAVPSFEATVIRRLRAQGAVLLGKTVGTQWANYRNPRLGLGGWSAVGGQCLAPYHEAQDPAGSSSGSAVAASLGLSAATLGTETSGSLSTPAQSSAVVSIKPTVGLTSRYGVYSVSEWQDTVGVLASSVRNAATVLTAIFGPDPNDAFTESDPRDSEDENARKPPTDTNFADACTSSGLKGKRIAVPRHLIPDDPVVNAAFDEALNVMTAQGATIVDNVRFSEFDMNYSTSEALEWTLAFRIGLRENMRKTLSAYTTNPHEIKTLQDLIKYTQETDEEENEKRGVDEWLKCEELGQQYHPQSAAVKKSQEWRNLMGLQIAELLKRTECDLIFVPSSVDASANIGGCPTVGVPLGFYPEDTPIERGKLSGLVITGPRVPFGGLFVGRRWDDYDLIAAAFAYEQASQVRKQVNPIISPDAEL